jgi:hypothetical protein
VNALHENPFARSARAAKLARLLDAADLMATAKDLHPRRDAAAISAWWIDATVDDFAKLLTVAKILPKNAPSATTWGQFLEALAHRADRGAS